MEISLFVDGEEKEIAALIERTCRISFANYYPLSEIEKIVTSLNEEGVKKRASWTHFYTFKKEGKIVACGAIGPYWGSETESSLFTIFVDPDHQGGGIGRKIIETLEQDEYFLRASRIEIPASFVALPFYIKCGYKHKDGKLIYEDGNIKLEKFRQV